MIELKGSRNPIDLNRRKLLKSSAVVFASTSFPQIIKAKQNPQAARSLEFLNLHTNESIECCYWKDEQYDVASLDKINQVLRDHRTDEIYTIEPSLLELLHTLHNTVGSTSPFHVISGYRSPASNKKLRKNSNGVAKRSLHMQGKAIDIRLPDINLSQLRDTAISLQAGGVGYYASSNFIHLDVGRTRNW